MVADDDILKPMIETLFKLGRQNSEILTELKAKGFPISLATLKRRLQAWGMKRIETKDRAEIKELIKSNIEGIHTDAGYRRMAKILLVHQDTYVKHDTVREIMKELDPDGVISRQKRVLKRRSFTAYLGLLSQQGPTTSGRLTDMTNWLNTVLVFMVALILSAVKLYGSKYGPETMTQIW